MLIRLLVLLPDEEMIRIVERCREEDAWLLELPYLRRSRAEGRRQGEVEVLLRLLRWSEQVLCASTLDAVFAE